MTDKKKYRTRKHPRITARFLADYMEASETRRRTILRESKFQPVAAIVQHREAKSIVSKSLLSGNINLGMAAEDIRNRLSDSDFERRTLDHNADYVDRFAAVKNTMSLPTAEFLPPGRPIALSVNGVLVNVEFAFRLRRLTRTNKVRIGAATLRYEKGNSLSADVAKWHAAFLHGYIRQTKDDATAEPEFKLCLVIDAYAGICHNAPTNSRSRFKNMEAACRTIAEHWNSIPPPPNADLSK